jgi:hypothetical protein
MVVVTALAFDFTNGFHDTGNAMASSIATGALSPKAAVTLAATLDLVGALISVKVALTITNAVIDGIQQKNGLPNPEFIGTDNGKQGTLLLMVVLAGLVGGIVWNLFTWLLGLPSSSSHALLGGLVGATIAGFGFSQVNWLGHSTEKLDGVVGKVLIPRSSPPSSPSSWLPSAPGSSSSSPRRWVTSSASRASATARSARPRSWPSRTAPTTPRRRWVSSPWRSSPPARSTSRRRSPSRCGSRCLPPSPSPWAPTSVVAHHAHPRQGHRRHQRPAGLRWRHLDRVGHPRLQRPGLRPVDHPRRVRLDHGCRCRSQGRRGPLVGRRPHGQRLGHHLPGRCLVGGDAQDRPTGCPGYSARASSCSSSSASRC